MAVTTQYSAEYNKAFVTKTDKLRQHEQGGEVKVAYFVHTQSGTGDAGSSALIAKLPAGRIRLLASACSVFINWADGSAAMDVGWDAYTNIQGTAVAADPDGLDDGVSVATEGTFPMGSAVTATGGTKVFESTDGVGIRITGVAALADGEVAAGYLLYVVEN